MCVFVRARALHTHVCACFVCVSGCSGIADQVRVCVRACAYTSVCIADQVRVCVRACAYTSVCLFVRIRVGVWVCVYVSHYVCVCE